MAATFPAAIGAALERDAAGARSVRADDAFEQRRLAGTVMAEDADASRRRQVQRDAA